MPRKAETVNARLVRTLGVRRAVMVETFVMLWAMYAATEGRDPERMEDLADAVARNRSTLFRWQAEFREAFPEFATPRDLLDRAGVPATAAVNVPTISGLAVA